MKRKKSKGKSARIAEQQQENDTIVCSEDSEEEQQGADYSKGAGVVHSVTVYKNTNRNVGSKKPIAEKYAKASIEDLIAVYKNEKLPQAERDWAFNEAYLKVFFLLPHMVKQHKYSLNATLFDDAMQNLSLAFMNAVRRFKPEYGTKFVYYFVGDMLSAMRKTFRDMNIVKVPTAKLKKAGYMTEEQIAGSLIDYDTTELENTIDSCIEDNSKSINCYDLGDGDGLYAYDDDTQVDISTDRVLSSKLVAYDDGTTRSTYDIDEDMYVGELHDWLEELLSSEAGVITPEEREVVILHNGLFGRKAMLYSEITELKRKQGISCTRPHVSALHTSAMHKLAEYVEQEKINLL